MDESEPKSPWVGLRTWIAGMIVLLILGAVVVWQAEKRTGKPWAGEAVIVGAALAAAGITAAVTAPPPRRPWWKKKRAWAAVALWLVILYPLSMGPAHYAVRRWWLPVEAYRAAYWPLLEAEYRLDPDRLGRFSLFHRYLGWWGNHARAASD